MDWSEFDRGVFLVNVLGIVRRDGKVLIGRREKDEFLPELSWCFPGGRPGYKEDLEHYLKDEIRKKTGLDVKVGRVVFAKTYPEKREFLSIYYLCEPVGGKEHAGEKFAELKWVAPGELENHFTTSLHPELVELIER